MIQSSLDKLETSSVISVRTPLCISTSVFVTTGICTDMGIGCFKHSGDFGLRGNEFIFELGLSRLELGLSCILFVRRTDTHALFYGDGKNYHCIFFQIRIGCMWLLADDLTCHIVELLDTRSALSLLCTCTTLHPLSRRLRLLTRPRSNVHIIHELRGTRFVMTRDNLLYPGRQRNETFQVQLGTMKSPVQFVCKYDVMALRIDPTFSSYHLSFAYAAYREGRQLDVNLIYLDLKTKFFELIHTNVIDSVSGYDAYKDWFEYRFPLLAIVRLADNKLMVESMLKLK